MAKVSRIVSCTYPEDRWTYKPIIFYRYKKKEEEKETEKAYYKMQRNKK